MTQPQKSPTPLTHPWELVTSPDESPANLELRFRTGDGCFFPYAYLTYCHYDQGGVIELYFASRILRLEGRNLRGLYSALIKQMVTSIQEDETQDIGAEQAPAIVKIEVTDADA